MKLKVNVTQDFINRGKRCDIGLCPIALALEEAFCSKMKQRSSSFIVTVTTMGIAIVDYTVKGKFFYQNNKKLSKKLTTFMDKFDQSPNKINTHPPVKPFKFEIDLKKSTITELGRIIYA